MIKSNKAYVLCSSDAKDDGNYAGFCYLKAATSSHTNSTIIQKFRCELVGRPMWIADLILVTRPMKGRTTTGSICLRRSSGIRRYSRQGERRKRSIGYQLTFSTGDDDRASRHRAPRIMGHTGSATPSDPHPCEHRSGGPKPLNPAERRA
jgi:hypothetical protein